MTEASAQREEWGPAEFGNAMAAYVEAHAKHVKRRGDGVTSEAFYRDGDNRSSLRVWIARGSWADVRANVSGGARDFARLVAKTDLVSFMRQWGRAAGTVQRPVAPRVDLTFPPRAQVDQLWASLVEVDRVPAARAWLEGRGLDAARIVDTDVLRAVPASIALPQWARQARRTWAEAFAIVAGLFDATGILRSLHARRTVDDSELSKTSSPAGHTTRGLVMADSLGRALLAGAEIARAHVGRVSSDTKRPAVVCTEGLPSLAAWATDASDVDEDAPAVIGILSGGWTGEHAARVPDGARVLVDTDHDVAGDGYAHHIADTFTGRAIDLGRAVRAA